MLPLQTTTHDDNEEALTGAATALSLLSPPTDNSASDNLSQFSKNEMLLPPQTLPLPRLI